MSANQGKPILLSGIQPSGHLTIGNYIGAVKNWLELQNKYDCIFLLVDMHTITIRQDPADLRKRTYDFLALYIACGIDPEKSIIIVQSHVPAHAELTWVLNCFTYMGELNRQTQYKDKSQKQGENINAGLYSYPVLMAADILLYQTDLVPVGADQKQHLELTRDVGQRFNQIYGETFKIPEPFIPPVGARIMSLQDPTSKMSKSDKNEKSYISLIDPPDAITRKIKRAVTDSLTVIEYNEDRPGISNLVAIYSALSGQSYDKIEDEYTGKGYAEFKAALTELIIETLRPTQEKYHDLRRNKDYLDKVLKEGAEQAGYRANKTLRKVYKKIGFIAPA